MAKTRKVDFEKLHKTLDTLEGQIEKGIDLGEVVGKKTEKHKELVAFTSRLTSISRTVQQMEKDAINEALLNLAAPLMEKANGDIAVFKALIQQAASVPAPAVKTATDDAPTSTPNDAHEVVSNAGSNSADNSAEFIPNEHAFE